MINAFKHGGKVEKTPGWCTTQRTTQRIHPIDHAHHNGPDEHLIFTELRTGAHHCSQGSGNANNQTHKRAMNSPGHFPSADADYKTDQDTAGKDIDQKLQG